MSDSGIEDSGEERAAVGPEEVLKNLVRLSVGLGSAVIKALPDAIAEGERIISQQGQTAEMIGKMAVTYVKFNYGPKVEAGLRDVISGLPGGLFRSGNDGSGQRDSDVATDGRETPSTSQSSGAVGGIAGYDALTAAQVIARLAGGDVELSVVEAYELANRRRRTILTRLSDIRESRISPQD